VQPTSYQPVRRTDLRRQSPRFTEPIGLKVTAEQYQTLKQLAERASKSLAEWCRDALLGVTTSPRPSPSDYGLMAELTATQAILIDLLCILGRDGRFTTQKAQEIVDTAHHSKYEEAAELLKYAYSKSSTFRLPDEPRSQPRKQERHE
jgi:hypothetical protein